jgi:hypothetical protein
MTHSEMEALIERDGREVVRSMVQRHLELRGLAKPEKPPCGVDDGAPRNHAAGTSRPLVSLLGPVTVGRTRYE